VANPTTNYGFVLPSPTDLVTDLPADFDVALQGVDTRLKALQPGTTLGDLAYSSATANTNTRLGIGSTGDVLTVTGGVPVWAAPAGGGKVLQVVTGTVSTAVSNSTATFVDTNLTATITPTSATSTVLVLISATINRTGADVNNSVFVNLLRGASVIYSSTNLGSNTATAMTIRYAANKLDSPATTSATTYKCQFRNNVTAASVSFNSNNDESTIVLMEIGA
jgi:hypothetical protein